VDLDAGGLLILRILLTLLILRRAARDSHYSGFDTDANAFLTDEVTFSQLQANAPSRQGAGGSFDRLATDFADGTFLDVSTIGGPTGRPFAGGMSPKSATGMWFCC
jgi:hypothetical protein